MMKLSCHKVVKGSEKEPVSQVEVQAVWVLEECCDIMLGREVLSGRCVGLYIVQLHKKHKKCWLEVDQDQCSMQI